MFKNCPEFPPTGPPRTDCISQFSADKCCRNGEVCGDDRNNLKICDDKGENITQGEKFTPKDHICYSCVCNEHYDSNKNPAEQPKSCRKKNCVFQSFLNDLDKFCAFVYTSDNCCPTELKCRKYLKFYLVVNSIEINLQLHIFYCLK